ncbi:MAG TPA: S-layer homology domain-containing protein [Fimbriimonas sp.]|nr:S-layer homology domain-containing protein [Fimbriimonas sp.]
MKRVVVLAALALGAASFAQAPPDVPANHWAAKAVTDLYQLGILRGYPDGLFRGARPATRYEMAQAINAMFGKHQQITTRQLEEIKALPQPTQSQNIQGLAEIRRRLDALETNVGELQSLRSETQDLTKRYEAMLEQVRRIREDLRNMRIKHQ